MLSVPNFGENRIHPEMVKKRKEKHSQVRSLELPNLNMHAQTRSHFGTLKLSNFETQCLDALVP